MSNEPDRELHLRTVRYVIAELTERASGKVGLIAPRRTDRPRLVARVAHALQQSLPGDKRCLILVERGRLLLLVAECLANYGDKPRGFLQGTSPASRYVLVVLREYIANKLQIEALNIGAIVMFTSAAGRLRESLPAYRSLCELAPGVPMVSIFPSDTAAAEFVGEAGYSVNIHYL